MTLNVKIGVLWIFWRFWAARHISRANFSALNVDFNGSSLDFLGSSKPVHEGIKDRYPRKSYFTVVGQSFMKTVADRHGHAAYHNQH